MQCVASPQFGPSAQTLTFADMLESVRNSAASQSDLPPPFQNSKWMAKIHCHIYRTKRDPRARGELVRCNLLSPGGVVSCSLAEYRASLPALAQDIRSGVVTTLSEIAQNSDGVRVFYELDYKYPDRFPSPEVVAQHLQIAYRDTLRAFPGLPPADCRMLVSKSDPKIKVKEGREYLAYGVHIVFPHIVVRTRELQRLSAYVNQSMTRETPNWADVVDQSPYKAEYANLRPNGSHKVVECPVHKHQKKAQQDRPGRRQRGGETEPVTHSYQGSQHTQFESFFGGASDWRSALHSGGGGHDEVACPPGCFKGKITEPSVYRLHAVYDFDPARKQAVVSPKPASWSLLDELRWTSICPEAQGQFSTLFRPPADMPGELDFVPSAAGPVVFEQRELKPIMAQMAKSEECRVEHHPELFQLVHQAIAEFFPSHSEAQLHHVAHSSAAGGRLYIQLKHQKCRFCLVQQREHNNNRVFFTLALQRGRLSFHCFKKECKAELVQLRAKTPVRKPASGADPFQIGRELPRNAPRTFDVVLPPKFLARIKLAVSGTAAHGPNAPPAAPKRKRGPDAGSRAEPASAGKDKDAAQPPTSKKQKKLQQYEAALKRLDGLDKSRSGDS